MEPWLTAYGAVLETIPHGYTEQPRFACFPTPQAGWSAMQTLLLRDYVGMTVAAALSRWAPAGDGNVPTEYIASVCRMSGLTPETVLTSALLEA